jgi:GNAT superfamily N-acetyltransferase
MRFGAIIQNQVRPGDVFAMGDSAELIWELLGEIDGWRRISARPGIAGELGAIVERETGVAVGYDDAVYQTLRKPAPPFHDSIVRVLTLRDLPLLEAAAPEVRGRGFGDVTKLLDEGIVACAIVDGEIVTCARTEAVTDRHADIRVSTLEPWRGRAFATAAASMVAGRAQDSGRVPVWNAKLDDYPSLRIADKLGFEEVSRRTLIDRSPAGN